MYIEIVTILGIIFTLTFFFAWKGLSSFWLKRRYNPENDKSRLGEEARRSIIAEGKAISTGSPIEFVPRPPESSERIILPSESSDSIRENSISTGKTTSAFRRFFQRRK